MKRLHSLSAQDNQPGEQFQRMTRKKAALSTKARECNERTPSSPMAHNDTNLAGPGQADQANVVSMASLVRQVSCGLCDGPVESDSITCHFCDRKYHASTHCTGLKPNSIQCLREEDRSSIEYRCLTCRCAISEPGRAPVSGNVGGDGEWKEAVGQVLNIVKSLAANISLMSNTMNSILQNQQNHPQTSTQSLAIRSDGEPPISRKDLYSEMWEFEERKKRSGSIIVKGTNANSTGEFSDKFRAVYQYLLNSTPRIASVHCVCPEKKMYRVTFMEKSARVDIMNVAKNLKDASEYRNIFISRDLTKAQRSAITAARAERRGRQRDSSGGRPGERGTSERTTGETSSSSNILTGVNTEPIRESPRNNNHPPIASPSFSGGASRAFQ